MSRARRTGAHLAAAILAALVVPCAAQAEAKVEVRAELMPDPVGLDETARLTLIVESAGFGMPRVDPGFLLDNLEGAGGPSRSQSTSWVNGESSSRLELTWRLRPVRVGTARVHEMRVEVGQEIRSLPEMTIQVVEQAPPGRSRPPSARPADPFARLFDDDPFGIFPRRRRDEPAVQPKLAVRSLVEPQGVWVGQQVVWTLALDTQTDISGFRPRAMPEFKGFWTREIEVPQPPRPEWVEVDGAKFGRVEMSSRALFPLRDGELPIERITVDVLARMVDTDWIGNIRRDEPLELSTRPLSVVVKPLPPAPPEFSGLVGSLTLEAELDPRAVSAGQATTLLLRAVTDGNPHGMAAPDVALPAGLRAFPPSTSTSEQVENGRLVTQVEWRYVILADRAGEVDLAPISIAYFDPSSSAYAVARTRPLQLVVSAAAGAGEAAPAAPAPAPAPESPVSAGVARRASIVAAAAIVALVAFFVVARSRRRRTSPMRRLRAALDEARAIESPRQAAKAIDAAWRQALGERCGLARGTPLTQWPTALADAGWRDESVRELVRLFEEIHLLEFAPELADADALRLDIERRSRELARRLR